MIYNINDTLIWKQAFIESFNINEKQLISLEYSNNNQLSLYTENISNNRFITLKKLIPVGYPANDFLLMGVDYRNIVETSQHYANQLYQLKNDWDYLVLSEVPENDIILYSFIKELINRGFQLSIDNTRSFFFINLLSTYESYYNDYFHNKNRDLRTRINKLKREQGEYSVITRQENLLYYWHKMLNHYKIRRAITGQKNAFDDSRLSNMLINIIPHYEAKGWAQISILQGPDRQDWAYQFDFIKDGIQYHYAPSFDMRFASYSPSKILLLESIKSGFLNPNLVEFNFMRGESDYKKQFAYEKTSYININVINPFSKRIALNKLYNYLTYPKLWLSRLCKK